MQQERNRVIEGMQEWKTREQTIADLFSASIIKTRYVQQLKLDHLYEQRNKLRGEDLSKDERAVLRILRGEIKMMEQVLYPSTILRYLMKLGRKLKPSISSSIKKVPEEFPSWKLKTPAVKISVQQKSALHPTLVQKKKQNLKKGLKIKS